MAYSLLFLLACLPEGSLESPGDAPSHAPILVGPVEPSPLPLGNTTPEPEPFHLAIPLNESRGWILLCNTIYETELERYRALVAMRGAMLQYECYLGHGLVFEVCAEIGCMGVRVPVRLNWYPMECFGTSVGFDVLSGKGIRSLWMML